VAGKLVFSEPKNASRRTIDLPQRALETLRTHRKRQLEEQLRSGAAWADNGLVFATTIGTPLEAQNIINRHFKPCSGVLACRTYAGTTSGTPPRRSCSPAAHPKLVQHLLGHASITTTLDTYSHWIPSMGRATAAAMDAALEAPDEATTDEASG
jgi:integrase